MGKEEEKKAEAKKHKKVDKETKKKADSKASKPKEAKPKEAKAAKPKTPAKSSKKPDEKSAPKPTQKKKAPEKPTQEEPKPEKKSKPSKQFQDEDGVPIQRKPGQKYPEPSLDDPTRAFYESLYEQNPKSLMAQKYCLDYGLLPEEVAQKLLSVFNKKK